MTILKHIIVLDTQYFLSILCSQFQLINKFLMIKSIFEIRLLTAYNTKVNDAIFSLEKNWM